MDHDDDTAKSREAREFEELLAASGRNQTETAAVLTRKLGRKIENYQISRWAHGKVKVGVDVMDAMRDLVADKAPGVAEGSLVFNQETADTVPLFGYVGGPGVALRLTEEQRVGVAPTHPAQRGSRSAFAFIHFGEALGDRLSVGDIAYAVRNRSPRKGQLCVVEMINGEARPAIFEGADERTLFTTQLAPRRETTSTPMREVAAIHAIVGVTFGS